MARGYQIVDIECLIEAHKNGISVNTLAKQASVSRDVLDSNFRRVGYDCTGKHPVPFCKGECGCLVTTIGYEYCHDCQARLFRSGENDVSKRPEVRKKISDKLTGRVFTDEWKAKLSKNHHLRGKLISGPIIDYLRSCGYNQTWAKSVLERDNYTCRHCGKRDCKLDAHHYLKSFSQILYEFYQQYSQYDPIEDNSILISLTQSYLPFWDVDNGLTLCKSCHKKEHKHRREIVLVVSTELSSNKL